MKKCVEWRKKKKYGPIKNKLLFDDLLFDQSYLLDQNTAAHYIKKRRVIDAFEHPVSSAENNALYHRRKLSISKKCICQRGN
jgi:hypothetical protein